MLSHPLQNQAPRLRSDWTNDKTIYDSRQWHGKPTHPWFKKCAGREADEVLHLSHNGSRDMETWGHETG